MSVLIHKTKSIKDTPTLTQELETQLAGLTKAEARLVKDNYIREQLAANKSYNAWDYLEYYGYKNEITLKAQTALVSIRGEIAYDLDDGMHISSGEPEDGYLQVTVPVIGHDTPIGVARAVASTFLSLPDKYKDVSFHDLEVTHLDGQTHQTHLANLEWALNEGALTDNQVEVTITALNAELPSATENE